MKSKTRLILEVDQKAIKACEAKILNKKKAVIGSLKAKDISGYPAPEDIRDICPKFFSKEYKEIIISLSRSFFLIRILRLPSQDEAEIAKMLPFQLAKVIPYPLDEVIYAFSILDREKGFSKLLVFTIQKNRIENFIKLVPKSKMPFLRVTITSWGLENWLVLSKDSHKKKFSYPVVLIDVDKWRTQLIVAGKQGLFFSREFVYSADEQITQGIRQSLAIFEEEFGKQEFSQAVFTGIKKDQVIDGLEFKTSSFIGDGERFSFRKGLVLEPQERSFAAVLGLSQNIRLSKFDFSPLSLELSREKLDRKKRYLDAGVVVLEAMIIVLILGAKYVSDKYAFLDYLNSKLRGMKVETTKIDAVVEKLNILDREIFQVPMVSGALQVLVSSLPQDAHISFLEIDQKGSLVLKGYANNMSSVFSIVKAVNGSGFFQEVKVKYAAQVKRRGKEEIEFYIHGQRRMRRLK